MTDKEKGNVIDWLTEITENQEQWSMFYSASEQKLLAENALALLKEQEGTINALESDLKETLEELASKGKEQEPKYTLKNGIGITRCGVCGSVLSHTIHSIPDDD